MDGTRSFDGIPGRLAALVMARVNSDTESAAVAHLAPAPDEDVLVIGFGPGVGLHMLTEVITTGHIAGIDPSRAMLGHAPRRNRAACQSGLIDLRRGRAGSLPWPDQSFDAAIAVNCIQFWAPLRGSVAEVARVLRPAGRFVSFTHEWAIRRHGGGPLTDGSATLRPYSASAACPKPAPGVQSRGQDRPSHSQRAAPDPRGLGTRPSSRRFAPDNPRANLRSYPLSISSTAPATRVKDILKYGEDVVTRRGRPARTGRF